MCGSSTCRAQVRQVHFNETAIATAHVVNACCIFSPTALTTVQAAAHALLLYVTFPVDLPYIP
jgi:hypothetical protein